MIVWPLNAAFEMSNGELPKSKPSGCRPPTSPMQTWPEPAARKAKASSTEPTMMMRDAPFARATAAVVKARNTSMTATAPLACLAPSSRLAMTMSIAASVAGVGRLPALHHGDLFFLRGHDVTCEASDRGILAVAQLDLGHVDRTLVVRDHHRDE